jgi:nucleoside-triphosphatase THEP1
LLKKGHYILTGEINSGKTTVLTKFFNDSAGKKIIAGWLSPKEYDIHFIKGSKIISKMPLARKKPFKPSVKFGHLWFNENAFKEASKIDFGECDIFIIDEIGPLELEEKKGFCALLPGIYKKYDTTITVIRTSCLNSFTKIFSNIGVRLE